MKKIHVWSALLFMTVSAAVFDGRIAKGADADSGAISAGTIDELKDLAEKEVEDRVASMNEALEQLETDLDTYEKYVENSEKMEAFYSSVSEETKSLCLAMREYALAYAKLIFSDGYFQEESYDDPDDRFDDIYDELDDLYDDIYDDASDDIYNGIYDGLLDDAYDAFYDGILDDAYDDADYKEWYDVHSDAYDQWSDTRSDVYDEWSDLRSDIYDFWSDLRSDAWDNDMEDAEEDIQDFQEDIDRLKEKIGADSAEGMADETAAAEEVGAEQGEAAAAEEAGAEQGETAAAEEVGTDQGGSESAELEKDGLSPEFTAAMDSYEAFIDEYCDFMKKYAESDGSDVGLLTEYGTYMEKYAEMMEDFEAWNNNQMSAAETAYYLEVQSRTMGKLIEVLK